MIDGGTLWRRFADYPLLHPELRGDRAGGAMPRMWEHVAAAWPRASMHHEGRAFAVVVDDGQMAVRQLAWAAEGPTWLTRQARAALERLADAGEVQDEVVSAEQLGPAHPAPGAVEALCAAGFQVARWWLDYRLRLSSAAPTGPGPAARQMRLRDADDVCALCRGLDLDDPEFGRLDQVRVWYERPDHTVFVAHDELGLVAYCAVQRYTASQGQQSLYVRAVRAARRDGGSRWAEQALLAALDWARGHACADSMVWVERDDAGSRRLYERAGYAACGEANVELRYAPAARR
jgi:hypothetical protein